MRAAMLLPFLCFGCHAQSVYINVPVENGSGATAHLSPIIEPEYEIKRSRKIEADVTDAGIQCHSVKVYVPKYGPDITKKVCAEAGVDGVDKKQNVVTDRSDRQLIF
jgi:hypothetical protein